MRQHYNSLCHSCWEYARVGNSTFMKKRGGGGRNSYERTLLSVRNIYGLILPEYVLDLALASADAAA